MFFYHFFVSFFKNKRFTHSLVFKERCEQVAQVAHDKRATVSESLRLLTKSEQPWHICLGHSPKMSNREIFAQVAHQKWANEQIANFFERITHLPIFSQKNQQFTQKTDERIPNPAKIIPVLWLSADFVPSKNIRITPP